ncbi:MAG: methyltransferase domain-containing protein, partial [Chthoniobacterales bacterium]
MTGVIITTRHNRIVLWACELQANMPETLSGNASVPVALRAPCAKALHPKPTDNTNSRKHLIDSRLTCGDQSGHIMSRKLYAVFNRISPYFRKKRMQRFFNTFPQGSYKTLLDVGGYPWFWREFPVHAKIIVVNLHNPEVDFSDLPHLQFLNGDGLNLTFKDKSYDIAFSNSVIEHLFTFDRQKQFASEMSRVGNAIWCQTPAKEFFIEPHFLTPFFHFFPVSFRKRIVRRFTIWGWLTNENQETAEALVDEIRLLTYKE